MLTTTSCEKEYIDPIAYNLYLPNCSQRDGGSGQKCADYSDTQLWNSLYHPGSASWDVIALTGGTAGYCFINGRDSEPYGARLQIRAGFYPNAEWITGPDATKTALAHLRFALRNGDCGF